MGYSKYPTNRRYLALFRSEKRRGVLDPVPRYLTLLHVLQENLEGPLDLLDGGTQSPTGGTSFLFVYPPTWYLDKRRDEREMREIRDTKSLHFSVPTSEKGTGIRLGASVDLIYKAGR